MDLTTLAGVAAGVTKSVDATRNALDRNNVAPKVTWNLVAAGYGLLGVWLMDLNLFPAKGFPGQIVTGVIVSGGAAFLHEVMDFFSSKAKAASAVSLAPIEPMDKEVGK